jgi:pilus assembly protein CpaC
MMSPSALTLMNPSQLCAYMALSLMMIAEPCWPANEITQQIALKTGQAVTLSLPESVHRIALADPSVADVSLVNARELYVLGKRSGKTNLLVWTATQKTQSMNIEVAMDLQPLEWAFQHYFPEESALKVSQLGRSIVLNGTVSDAVKAHQIILLSRAFLQTHAAPLLDSLPTSHSMTPTRFESNHATVSGSTQSFDPHSSSAMASPLQLINLLRISVPQQVRLDVKVAEVSKTWLQQWGAKVGLSARQGAWSASLGSALSNTSAPASLALGLASGDATISVTAQTQDSLIKTLAEPSLLAMSGQQASFLAGGKVFIPVVQSTAQGAPLSSLEEKEFGIALKFTPTVLDGGRIHLKVAPEVSELNPQGLGLAATGVSGQAILPLFTTRRASTAVELRDGESFAIGGLMQNNVNSSIQAVPWLADIPILGTLFRSSQFQKDQTELLFVVTPHLVSSSDTLLPLPTDHYSEPTQKKFFLEGKQQEESEAPSPHFNASSYSEALPEGYPAEFSRKRSDSEAAQALRALDRYQADDGSALPMLGLPRATSSLIGAPQ